MFRRSGIRGVALAAGLLAAGCTSLREVPRAEYAAAPERKHVRVVTREGLVYEFDYIAVSGDTLIGFRRQETESAFEEYASMRVPLDEVTKLSARRLDWYRTGLIGGGVLAALVARGLADTNPETGPSQGDPSPGEP